jgi:N6-adenosine-specific RNA methylase IME4/uncharacterized ParB-like nuclease family protein
MVLPKVVPIDKIQLDDGIQVRGKLDEKRVELYAEAMQRGDKFPAVDVFQQEGEDAYLLADGFHRLAAARKVGRKEFEVNVVKVGNRRDAILHAIEVNSKHGELLGKRRAITLLLNDPEWAKWSNTEIARHCGASESFVRKIRGQLSSHQCEDAPGCLVQRGRGKPYLMRKRKARAKPASTEPQAPVVPAVEKEMKPTSVEQVALPEPIQQDQPVPTEPVQRPVVEQQYQNAFAVIAAHIPWASMRVEDIAALPVRDLARPHCILWLRAETSNLPDALRIVQDWGFQYDDLHTLVKTPRPELGERAIEEYEAEHWVVAVRGDPRQVLYDDDRTRVVYEDIASEVFYDLAGFRTGRKCVLFAHEYRDEWTSFDEHFHEIAEVEEAA